MALLSPFSVPGERLQCVVKVHMFVAILCDNIDFVAPIRGRVSLKVKCNYKLLGLGNPLRERERERERAVHAHDLCRDGCERVLTLEAGASSVCTEHTAYSAHGGTTKKLAL